ncbi:TIR domain-containing protein [Mesorhizobium sp. WSM4884]|uniref:TIR domain-containing protein n=1 Tax=Mesorhizobium sp. WSM4884 TaxID=3038542 RepID=UPI00241656C8|nr:TIR domain-containing protein [Mesorhizobium sp. WSM4884]MDG4885447.1 nucleotide-binding protein [Mesorhizobium sp. WSM4884]
MDELAAEPLPRPEQQILLLLRWIADQAGDDRFYAVEVIDEHVAGIIGSVDGDGASMIVQEADDAGLVGYTPDNYYHLTVRGWAQVESVKEEERQLTMARGRIFIGHGRSHVWRDLKDFLSDRLHLEWDEFNRESAAGVSTTERLENMLDNATFAFLVMTAEDQTADGTLNPRMNVVHEAGLFQGRLGFKRAIILLEEGCQDFSNVTGLGQIRFPPGNVDAKRDEIRQVLEREGIVKL